jgi:glycerol-3-phosphate dehydrogenase
VNRIYPAAGLSRKDVSFAHAGLLPMESRATGSRPDVVLTKHEQVVENNGTAGPLGSISVTGVKYTTSVQVADRVANLILKHLGRSNKRVRTEQPLYGGDGYRSAGIEPPAQTCTDHASTDACLMQRYGSRYRDITRYGEEAPSLGLPVAENCTTIAAEVVHAVRYEMAYKLTDVVLRRTGLGTLGYPGQATICSCASLMAAELGWSAQQLKNEIRAVEDIYRVYGIAGQPTED